MWDFLLNLFSAKDLTFSVQHLLDKKLLPYFSFNNGIYLIFLAKDHLKIVSSILSCLLLRTIKMKFWCGIK